MQQSLGRLHLLGLAEISHAAAEQLRDRAMPNYNLTFLHTASEHQPDIAIFSDSSVPNVFFCQAFLT